MKINYLLLFSFVFIAESIAQCPLNPYAFHSQADVNNFQSEFPNCEDAYVFSFWGNDITDLSPLSHITSINHLLFYGTDNITSLMAFDNAQIIGSLHITDSDGISTLDGIHFSINEELTSLSLQNNSILDNIDALDDLNLSIASVTIKDNPNLSNCAVKRVCKSLSLENATISISKNGVGCNSQAEVAAFCLSMSVDSFNLNNKIVLAPNPTTGITQLAVDSEIISTKAVLYSQFGQQLMIINENIIDISHLANGIYFLSIATDQGVIVKKIVKQ